MKKTVDERKHYRVEVQWPIAVFSDHGLIEGETTNISTEGVSICCDEPLKINESYQIYIIPLTNKAIEITGRVVWSNLYGIDEDNTAVGIGICFVEISDKDRHTIQEIIAQTE